MKKLLICFIACISISSFAGPLTYKDLALNEELNVPSDCGKLLKQHYEAGNDLSSENIRQQIVLLSNWPKEKGFSISPVFYNYNDVEAYAKVAAASSYDDIFQFFKRRPLIGCCKTMFNGGIYLANDAVSSRQYGHHLLELELSSATHVIDEGTISWRKVNEDLEQRGFGALLKACDWNLRALILEDSGVQLVFYMKYLNKYPWFILLNSSPIDKATFTPNAH
jgi:hypothetical protein